MGKKSNLSPISERFIYWIRRKNMTVAQFERETGLSNGYVRNLKRQPSPDYVNKIKEKFPDFPFEEIVFGKTIKPYQIPVEDQMIASEDVAQYVGMKPMSISGLTSNDTNAPVAHESEDNNKDYKNLYFGSLKTIDALKKAVVALTELTKTMCGDNPTLVDLGEK